MISNRFALTSREGHVHVFPSKMMGNIEELHRTGISFMSEGSEKQIDVKAMADLLVYLNLIR